MSQHPPNARRWIRDDWCACHIVMAGASETLCGSPVDGAEPPADDRGWAPLATETLSHWFCGGGICGRCLRSARSMIRRQEQAS